VVIKEFYQGSLLRTISLLLRDDWSLVKWGRGWQTPFVPKSKLPFLRARQPDQIEQRREAILGAALALFQRRGLDSVSLNDIAREVDLAKSNIYRYFESREHIYLIVLQRLAAQFERQIYSNLHKLKRRGSVRNVAEALVAAYLASPEYGELITVVNSVLEKRLTPDLVVNFRTVFLERRKRLAAALADALPSSSAEQMLPITLHIFLHVPGLWTFCFPSGSSAEMLDSPENEHLRVDFRREMTLFLCAMLRKDGHHLGRCTPDRKGGAVRFRAEPSRS
jgi:AcrR family transcriptional regulator